MTYQMTLFYKLIKALKPEPIYIYYLILYNYYIVNFF